MNFSPYENIINNYELNDTLFYKFCETSDREEFLQFQLPFYKAVEAFPRMLCLLGVKIPDSETRLQIIENIWEEHGQGNSQKFHTHTFKNYLNALGAYESIPYNLFVDRWINKCLSLNYEAGEYAAYLAGIEFIYTRVSHTITKKVESFNVFQEHYKVHEVLDYQHATELLETAYFLKVKDYCPAFNHGVEDFIDLLNQLTFLNKVQVQNISKEKIAFYYSREDSSIEMKHTKDGDSVVCIASGGEHIFHLLEKYQHLNITALDVNSHQLELVKEKSLNLKQLPCILEKGKFESIFHVLAQKLNHKDIYSIEHDESFALEKLRMICDDLFSKQNLNTIFTDNATKYTEKSFQEHFFNVFKEKIKELDNKPSNMYNILNFGLPCEYPKEINQDILFWHGDFYSYFSLHTDKKDVISISNIGDWMELNDYIGLIEYLTQQLNPNGKIIARKLLGDYSLEKIMNDKFNTVFKEYDTTGFYTECFVGQI